MTSKLPYAGAWERPGRSLLEFAARLTSVWKSPAGAKKVAESPTPIDETLVEILARLDGDHLAFHEVTSRYGKIDHVVLSAAHGIFMIETKPHSGRVSVVDSKLRVNGKLPEKDFVAQALRNTYWLIEEIRNVTGMEPSIAPLIVFTNAAVDLQQPLKGIPITDRRALLATLQREGEPMQPALWEARGKIAAALTAPPVEAEG